MPKSDISRRIDGRPAIRGAYTSSGGGGGGGVVVDLSGFLRADGTVPLLGNLAVIDDVTIDGVDISELENQVNLILQSITTLTAADTLARTGYTVLTHSTHLVYLMLPTDTFCIVRDDLFADGEEIALSDTNGNVEYMQINGNPVFMLDDDGAGCWYYNVFRRTFTDPIGPFLGWAVSTVVAGLTQHGYIVIDSRDVSTATPRISVFAITDFWERQKKMVAAIGNLTGVADFQPDSMGFAVGELTDGTAFVSYDSWSEALQIVNADIFGRNPGSGTEEVFRIYGKPSGNHTVGDFRFGRFGGRLELWNEEHKLAMLNGEQEVFVITPDGARFMEMVWAGEQPGPQVGIGKDGDDALLAVRSSMGGPAFVATARPTGLYLHAGNQPPLPNHFYYDQVTNKAGFDGSFTVRDMIIQGQISFGSIGSIKVLNPTDPNRYGMIVPHGIYGYTVDAGGQQHISSVIAWAPLVLDTEPGLAGYTHTFTAGEAMLGRRRYRHFRVEPGADGLVGLFNGDDPKAYLDAQGNAVIDGSLYAWNGEVVVGRDGHGIEIPVIAGDIDEVARLVTFVDNASDYRFMAGFWSSTDSVVSEASDATVNRINVTLGTFSEAWSANYRSAVRVLSNAGPNREAWLRLQSAGNNGAANQAIIDLYSLRGGDGSHSRIDLNANVVRTVVATAEPVATTGQTLSNGSLSYPDGSGWHPFTYITGGQYMVARLGGGWVPFAQAWATARRMGAATVNYAEFDAAGSLTFTGNARITPRYKSVTKAAGNFNVDVTEASRYRVNATGGATTATLPTADATNKGTRIKFSKVDSGGNAVTISTVGSGNIVLSSQWAYCEVEAQDSSWERVG